MGLKIVHELNQLDFGGVERIVRSIIKHDKTNEHTVLTYKDGPFRAKLEEVGAKIVVVGTEDEVDMEADVIHIHTGGSPSMLANSIGNQFPVVETIHSPVRSAVKDELVYKRVGVCEAVAKINSKSVTIHNGLEIEEIEDAPYDPTPETQFISSGLPVIGRVGRLGPDKGLEEWLLVCYYLQQQGYEFTPLIVGAEARDCEGYVGKLKLMAESLPVKGVVWAGHQADTRTWFQAIDIFLYPSRTEGFGLVFAEALFHSCAVVAYKTDVTQELFAGYARLVPPEAGLMSLVAETAKVLANVELRDELRGLGHDFVEDQYDAEAMSLKYQELYNECCDAYPNKQSQDSKTNVVFAR